MTDVDDWDESPYVACDDQCMALKEPETLEEYRAALNHWKYHSHLCGCSHGC